MPETNLESRVLIAHIGEQIGIYTEIKNVKGILQVVNFYSQEWHNKNHTVDH